MKTIELTKDEQKQLIAAKKQLLTDRQANPSANTRSHNIIGEVSKKYNVNTQVVYDSIDWHLPAFEK